jgi:hypothetical protein
MATDEEKNTKKPHNGCFDFLRKPRTYPENWDITAISMPGCTGSSNGKHMQFPGPNSQAEDKLDEARWDQVSFTEWQLSRHLDQFDKPEQDHFSAY